MGNNNSTQIAQLNLSQNLIPQDSLDQYNQLIVSDIYTNIANNTLNIPVNIASNTISQNQLVTYINKLDLYSQVVNSISTITAQSVSSSDINTLVTNAMQNKTALDLIEFNTQIKTINSNINQDMFVVTNQNFINLISNIVKNNLDVKSIINCFLSHISGLDNIQLSVISNSVQKAISTCTDIQNQIKIIINNICSSLNIKITATNTIKTPQDYLKQFQSEYAQLQQQYNNYNTIITGPDFAVYNDDPSQIKKLHQIIKQMMQIQAEQQQLENKIKVLQENTYLTPEILAMLQGKVTTKNTLDASGNKSLNYNMSQVQQHMQTVNKNQTTDQNDDVQHNLSNNQNLDLSSNVVLNTNIDSNKTNIQNKESGFFGNVPKGVRIFIFITSCIILMILCSISIYYIWRAKRAQQLVRGVKYYNTMNDLKKSE